MRDKVSGAIAIPKASWGCAPALPNLMQLVFLRTLFHMKQCKNSFQGNRFLASGKRGFYPCFCLPACSNCPVALFEFATCFTKAIQLRIGKFQKMQLQQEKQVAISNLLRKCGLLAHTSAAFLKNCCTEKLFNCLRLVAWKRCFQGNRFSSSSKRGFHPCFCLPACSNCPVALSEFATCFTMAIQL